MSTGLRTIRRVAVTGGFERPGSDESLRRLAAALDRVGIGLTCSENAAGVLGCPVAGTLEELSQQVDMVIAIGGDGTMLRAARGLSSPEKPLLGINAGRLGFLSFAARGEEPAVAEALAGGSFLISPRSMLEVRVRRGEDGREGEPRLALNEVTITRGAIARMILLRTSVDGRVLTDYHADGLIVATPTGSSAYSLSAGGPILAPDAPVIVLTPICPHALSSRPVVLSEDETIELQPFETDRAADVMFTIDGQDSVELEPGDHLVVRRAARHLPLVMPQSWSFTDTLRRKLGWQNSSVRAEG